MVALAAGQPTPARSMLPAARSAGEKTDAGQLGLENHIVREAPSNAADNRARDVHLEQPILGLVAGAFHTCAILVDGHVRCWGLGTFGELGSGATDNRGDDAGEMFDALPNVDLGQGGTLGARALAAGGDHTCALLEDGRIKCWGLNQHGELGLGDRRTHRNLLAKWGRPSLKSTWERRRPQRFMAPDHAGTGQLERRVLRQGNPRAQLTSSNSRASACREAGTGEGSASPVPAGGPRVRGPDVRERRSLPSAT